MPLLSHASLSKNTTSNSFLFSFVLILILMKSWANRKTFELNDDRRTKEKNEKEEKWAKMTVNLLLLYVDPHYYTLNIKRLIMSIHTEVN